MKKYSSCFLFVFCILHFTFCILQSCSSSRSVSIENLSNIYKREQSALHPQFAIFHRTNTTSELHFKINSNELLYTKQTGNDNFTARISIHYKLIASYETKEIIDSATVLVTDIFSENTIKNIIGKIDFGATFTNVYLLEINFSDLNRNTTVKHFINIDKTNHNGRQNYILYSAETKTPLFINNIKKDERVIIKYRIPDVKLFVRYYHRDFPLPAPPFANSNMVSFEYNADSLFTIQTNNADTNGFVFRNEGFYHIQTDTNTREGITLFRFFDDFPNVKTPEELLQPLKFITTRQEFDAMRAYKNPKIPVDSFWVNVGGSHDRARELIRKFYNRITNANQFFLSYTEGWKTDRGLIYIIYGPPNVVYKSSDSENWVYGEENNFNSLTYTFLKVINPFTDNDYRLERSPVYKTGWFNAVEMWRQGRVYADK
ncbi:MAG: GWxTD domain-containing protein [Bacteroidota bacterium]